MGDGPDAQLGRLAQDRPADISARPHHKIGAKFLNQPFGPRRSGGQVKDRGDVVFDIEPGQPALKTLDGDRRKIKPRLRHQFGLHPLGIAGKQDLRLRLLCPDGGGDGDGWIDVAAGSPTGKQYFHPLTIPFRMYFFAWTTGRRHSFHSCPAATPPAESPARPKSYTARCLRRKTSAS